jgi:O-antigen/teichoic acid export membrane protein
MPTPADGKPPVDETPAPEAVDSPSLGKQATRGMLWTSLSSLLARGLGFAMTIVLTYWMARDDYGRASAAYTIAITLGFFSIPGLESELIRRKERFNEAAVLTWIICNAMMIALFCLAYFAAEPIARLFNAAGAGRYLRWSLFIPATMTLLVVANPILCRQLRFGLQSLLEVGGTLTNVGAAVTLAASGFGGFAVVIGQLARELVVRVGGTVATGLGWLQRPRLDGGLLRQMLGFGIPVYLSELLEFGASNWDNLFVAKVFGAEALGAYAVAYTIAYTPIHTISQRTASVVLSTVARFADDRQRRHDAVLRSLGAIMLALGPAAVLIMLDGPRVVAILFPSHWSPTVATLVAALSLVGFGLPLQYLPDYYFQAINKPRGTLAVMTMKVGLMFGALFLFGRTNVETAAWSVSGSFIVAGAGACALLRIVDGIPLWRIGEHLLPAAVGSTLMAGAIWALRRFVPLDANWLMLALEVGGGGVVYLAYELTFHRRRIREIIGTFLGRSTLG